MEIPGKVSLYCPLIEAKGTAATLLAVSSSGYYHVEVTIKGQRRAMLVPVAGSALLFSEPELEGDPDLVLER